MQKLNAVIITLHGVLQAKVKKPTLSIVEVTYDTIKRRVGTCDTKKKKPEKRYNKDSQVHTSYSKPFS